MSVAINSNYYAGYTMNSANKFKNVSDYSKYLTNKYKMFDSMQKCFCID